MPAPRPVTASTLALWLALATLTALTALSGCGNDDVTPSVAGVCTPGTTQACLCIGGGEGVQACQGDKTFSACVCEGADAIVADTSTGQDAGVNDSTESGDTAASSDTAAPSDTATGEDTPALEDASLDTTAPEPGCTSDKDCKAEGKVCDPLTQECVACLTDAECGESEHCVGLQCQVYTACTNSLGCKTAKGPDGNDQPICDPAIGECSACVEAADCPPSHDCKGKQCVPYASCKNSTDCGADEVCDKGTNRCVQCLGDNDCGANALCESGSCKAFVPCSSDKQCTPLGLLCDAAKGKCAQCLQHSDCPEIYNCQPTGVAKTGLCILDVCAQGQGACNSGSKVTCNAVGDGYGSPQSCPSQTTCVAPGGKPDCKAWACTPGQGCDGDKAVSCSDDGLTVLETQDCAANGQKCLSGVCKSLLCEPAGVYCDGKTVKQCSADGLSASEVKTCGGSEYCEAGACKAQACVPNQKGCVGNSVAECDAQGAGYLSGQQDCGSLKCIDGACKALVCKPASQYCEGGKLKTCSPDGLTVSAEQSCGSGQFCGTNGAGDAACMAQVCAPSQPGCDGNSAATCAADGSGWVSSYDCGKDGKFCVSGACKTQVCSPGKAYCDGAVVMQCAADGLSASAGEPCQAADSCSTVACVEGACKTTATQPDQTSCSQDGSKWCKAGACLSKSVWSNISWSEIFFDSLAGPSLPAGAKVMDSCCGHSFESFSGTKGFKQKSDWNMTYIPVTRSTSTWEAVEAHVAFPANQRKVGLCPLGEHYGSNGLKAFFCAEYNQETHKLYFFVGDWTSNGWDGIWTTGILTKDATIAPDKWHSFRIEYSTSTGQLRWLIDGVVVQEIGTNGVDELKLAQKSKASVALRTGNTCSCATGAVWSNLRVYSGQ